MKRLLYFICRVSRFYCRCWFYEDDGTGDEVDGPLIFFKSLTQDDIAKILMETTLTRWQLFWHNPLLMKPKLWSVGELVRVIAAKPSIFSELDKICLGPPTSKALVAAGNLPSPFTINVFCALMAWLGPMCKGRNLQHTWELCDSVAGVLYLTLPNLKK
ncbi:E1B protein small T-antigen [Duck adenovirus 1]|uniref:E1B protein small T-antigen n=1 Tax=Duck adenovirus 1 TaxID=130329 RepID=P87658_DADV1|nr:E1B protein, small T-antigen [Duck atadenovirus A]AP_000077.1 LH2 [Duck atadenovirus A]AGS11263.1 E1B protein small T-antigen [Duck adenovirus 1]AJA72381.1 E1B protein, small T-antigen [Duck adenovirus 1]AJA72410.1 E1B protein, small T-antigen [Duck adenovirus 1]WIA59675.1 E1B protein, small T-antigen [Duck atadenovirus A]CAA70798.1 E1B protein, small T-antigen [Duck adenovirus 1]